MTEITCHGRTWRVEIIDNECTITDPDGNIAHRSTGHESTAVDLAMSLDARRYGEPGRERWTHFITLSDLEFLTLSNREKCLREKLACRHGDIDLIIQREGE